MTSDEAPGMPGGSTLSYAAVAGQLELSRLRSSLIVGMALVQRFPTEDAWWAMTQDPEYIESMNALAEVVNDMRVDLGGLENADSPEAVADAVGNHHERALEAVSLVAEYLQVPSEDLLAVLINA